MSDKIYSVAVSCRDSIGWVEYDTENKTVKVCLDDAKAVEDAEKFLTTEHEIRVPHETLRDFSPVKVGRCGELPAGPDQIVGKH